MLSHPLKMPMILRLIGLNGPSREKKRARATASLPLFSVCLADEPPCVLVRDDQRHCIHSLLVRVCSLRIRVRHYCCHSHSHISHQIKSNLHVSAALIMSISMAHPPLQQPSFLAIIHTSASTFLQSYLLSSTELRNT